MLEIPRKKLAAAAGAVLCSVVLLVAGCKSAPARTDQQIAADVQSKISSESALNGQNIQASAQNGVVTLNGTVNDDASRALAANDTGSVNGVKTVINNLTVQPAQQASDQNSADVAARQYGSSAPEQREQPSRRDRASQRPDRSQRNQPVQQPQPAPPTQIAQNPQPAPPPAPKVAPAPPRPTTKTVTLPAGTVLPVRMTDMLDSGTAQPDQMFHGALASDIGVRGVIALPRGTPVQGRIVDVKEAAHFKGNAMLTVQLTSVSPHGQRVNVETDTFEKDGAGRGKNTAKKAGGGALLGALIGGLAGGGKGAAIGAIAGGGAGAGVNAVTRGQQAVIKSEEVVNFQLSAPVTLTVPLNAPADQGNGDVADPQLQPRQP